MWLLAFHGKSICAKFWFVRAHLNEKKRENRNTIPSAAHPVTLNQVNRGQKANAI